MHLYSNTQGKKEKDELDHDQIPQIPVSRGKFR